MSSGLTANLVKTFSSIYVLRFLEPLALGEWQKFTVFFPYAMILTLGVSNTINLDISTHFGANEKGKGLEKVSVAGFFISFLSLILVAILAIFGLTLWLTNRLEGLNAIYWVLSMIIIIGTINNNFLRSTFRSANGFKFLSRMQLYLSVYAVLIIPLGIWLGVLGLALHFMLAFVIEFTFMYSNRPFKQHYFWKKEIFVELIKTGTVLYIWNNLNLLYRSLPRLIFVLYGDILSLGLYSPVSSVNAVLANISDMINRYTFPKMAFLYGKYKDLNKVIAPLKRNIVLLLCGLFALSFIMQFILPLFIKLVLPNFSQSIGAVRIIVFAGPFCFLNLTLHKLIISVRKFHLFRYLVPLKFALFFATYFLIQWKWHAQMYEKVALTAVFAEFLMVFLYLFVIKKLQNNNTLLIIANEK